MKNSHQQNLELIADMIRTAQRRFYDVSPYYVLWGSAVFLASIIQFFLLQLSVANNAIGWAIFIPIAVIGQFLISKKRKKSENSKTHIENLLVSMWVAFGITLFIVLTFSSKLGENTYPLILCLYALSTFVSGTAFKIGAFVFGSIACWLFAIICFFITVEFQLLLVALGVLFAFVIPGVILSLKEKTELK